MGLKRRLCNKSKCKIWAVGCQRWLTYTFLKMHRHLPLELQARHLFATGLIDTVIIGNAYASEEELKQLAAVDRYKLSLGSSLYRKQLSLKKIA